ncbi:MAG: peptidoglycan DD-metalloendopeptidase family protein [Candidatus Kerfeldbacteria bacterium]|nr:peptidoglycan DD-metalloendopeptidase family protein [Candidatus Kerfeldbacteria bacterium]
MVSKTNSTALVLALAALIGVFSVAQQPAIGQTTTPPDSTSVAAVPDPISEINAQIEEKKKHISELQEQAEQFRQAAETATGQVQDIQAQIRVIDNQIAETNFAIQAKEEEIGSLDLQMRAFQQSIDQKTTDIDSQKGKLAEAIRQLDANTRTTTLSLVFTHSSLADFYSQAQATASISQSLGDSIGSLKRLREDLQSKQDQLSETRDEQKQAQAQLVTQKQSTIDQKNLKDQLLNGAKKSADEYETLAQQAAQEEQQANATINLLEKQLQAKLNGTDLSAEDFSSTGLIWPIGSRRVTAYFHDPEYPYRRIIGEHSGLDVGTPVGSPVRATADGVVSAAFSPNYMTINGRKVSALNYIAIIHPSLNGMSTRYLHMSAIYVHADQVVQQGDVIGLSGGAWGAAGSGPYSSGPHLHFEVRLNGLPDDPLKYLPGG